MPVIREQARAKLNLYLHVLAKRADGYHLLDSLVAFTSLADEVRVEAAPELSLKVTGTFARAAGEEGDNLVLRAARLLQQHAGVTHGAAISLTKNIPVGAGLGGGSADAAAALRALNQLRGLGLPAETLRALGAQLGADVPMCVDSTPAIARGVGDQLTPIALPPLHALLVYPHVQLLTADVYRAFRLEGEKAPIALPPLTDAPALLGALATTRNDLQRPAIATCAAVAELLLALETIQPPSPLVRMSGSGACCFALYETASAAESAAQTVRTHYPHWWAEAVTIG